MINQDGLFKIDNGNLEQAFYLCCSAWHFITDEIERSKEVGESDRVMEFERVLDTIENVRQVWFGRSTTNLQFSEAYIPLGHMRVILKCSS